MAMIIVIMMRSLGATKVIKNAKPRRQKLAKNFCPLLGIYQDGRIGACERQKNRGNNG